MKALSLDVVNTVAEFLILTWGSTTSLDVKNQLRKMGFEAAQVEVSAYLDQIHSARKAGEYAPYRLDNQEMDLVFENKTQNYTNFRLYSFKKKETPVTASPAPAKVPVVATATQAKAPKARTKAEIKDYIRRNIDLSSGLLATTLGISAASVAAYKANINR